MFNKSLLTVFSFILFIFFIPKVSAQDTQSPEMQKWMEYMTPSKMHEMLKGSVGNWKNSISMWMQPGAEPQKSEGTSTVEAIMGGRYFMSKYSGTAMGMPMEGMGIDGYDNAKKVFHTVWYDNFGTGVLFQEGKYNEKTKTFEYKGKQIDPMTGKEIKVRTVIKVLDEDNHLMEMYMPFKGKEFKSMEIKFTRVK